MRLTESKRQSMKEAIHQFLPDAKVYLYGSRTDDAKRGGDIDLLVITSHKVDFALRLKLLSAMYKRIGEQKIDLLIERPDHLREFAQMIWPEALPL